MTWNFPAQAHDMISGDRSVGDWRACDECARLIRAGKRDRLARRCVVTTIEVTRQIQDSFWSNRTGPGDRIGR